MFHRKEGGISKKSWERMKLMSMIPIEIDPKNTSPLPKSALEQNYEVFDKTVSSFARMLEYSVGDNINSMWDEGGVLKPSHHRVTPYEPSFSLTTSSQPEPASYHPNFDIVKPKTVAPTIQPIRPVPKSQRKDVTTASVLELYNQGIRNFEPEIVDHWENTLAPIQAEKSAKKEAHLTFAAQTKRDFIIAPDSITKNTPFYIPNDNSVNVPVFDNQTSHDFEFHVDSGRDYKDKANEAFDKLQPRAPVIKLDKQISRDYVPKKNERVEFLDNLAAQQQKMLEKFKSPKKAITKNVQQKSSFDKQLPRKPSEMNQSDDSKFPIDPLNSLKHIWPRVQSASIRPVSRHKHIDDVAFWSPTPGNAY